MDSEIGTYTELQENDQFEHGILTYLNTAAYGDMKTLINEVGIHRNTIPFTNLQQRKLQTENFIHESDRNLNYLANAIFTPLDMTDYEDNLSGWHELPGAMPITHQQLLYPLIREKFPHSDKLKAIETNEERAIEGTGMTFQSILEELAAEPEEEEDDEEEEEDYGEEDYGAEGGDEYGEEEYGEEAGEAEEDEWPPRNYQRGPKPVDRHFKDAHANLKSTYSEVEIGAFMKLLNVKPHR